MAKADKESRSVRRWDILRAADQVAVATCLALSLGAMALWWMLQYGPRERGVNIERAEPLDPDFKVDINSATWPELTLLPRIGEMLAKRVVASRELEGPFEDHHDLLRVEGIGSRTLNGILPYLTPLPDRDDVAGR